MKKIYILAVLFFVQTIFINAQDIHFSQFSASPSTLNPASTGIFHGDFRVIGNYKQQWKSIASPFKTYSFAVDAPLFRDKVKNGSLGAGISVVSDKAGDLSFGTTHVNLSISANKSVDDNNNISVGLQGGFAQRGIDPSSEQWGDQYDPTNPDGFNSSLGGGTSFLEPFSFGDFAAGILWNYDPESFKAHAGIALFHLNQPNQSFPFYNDGDKLNSKLVFHGGSEIYLKESTMAIIPKFLILSQGPQNEITLGSMVKYVLQEGSKYTGWVDEIAVYLGGWYRFGDAFILNGRFDYKNFAFGISYDINVSNLTVASASKGGPEFSLIYINKSIMERFGKKKASPLM